MYCREGCDFLRFATRLVRQYGDIVHVQVGRRHHYYLNRPEYIEQILLAGYQVRTSRPPTLRHVMGQGIITSQGEMHRAMRGLIQPFFHKPTLAGKTGMIIEENERLAASWGDGQVRDIAKDMTHLTLAIIMRTLVGDVYTDEATIAKVGRATHTLHQYSHQNPLSHLNMMIENHVPRLGRYTHAARARRFLDSLIYPQIEARRAARNFEGPDLLASLMRAKEAHPELRHFTDRHIRDELFTMLLAGHETTASALSWTWYLLSQHPEVERRFHEELDRVLAGRRPVHDDLVNLPYTNMVFLESMRFYPPVWTLGRRPADEGIDVGGYHIPGKSMILISPFLTHRDPRFFPDPERFDPERFTPEQVAARHPFAYFPFARGNRKCIGEPLAMMEGLLTLAAIGAHWRLKLVPGHRVAMDAFIALKPKYGMRMIVERRSPRAVGAAVSQAAARPASEPACPFTKTTRQGTSTPHRCGGGLVGGAQLGRA